MGKSHFVRFICAMMTQVPMTSGAKTASRRATPTLRMRPKTTCSASSDVAAKLADAIKDAENCVDDCAAEWDTVEELSAAAADARAPAKSGSPLTTLDPTITAAAKETIKTAAEAIKGAQLASSAAGEEALASAKKLKEAQDALKKTPKEATAADPRIEVLEGKITEALKEAEECVTDCGVEWDLVEELEEAVDRLKA